jgi:hypothetical protein
MMPRSRWKLTIAGWSVVVAICGIAGYRAAVKDWRAYVPCAPPGELEARTQTEFLSDAPATQRFRTLFLYFVHGFTSHSSALGGRVQYCGAGSANSASISGLEGFARTAPLLAAWVYSGRGEVIEDPVDGRQIDLVDVLRKGILSGVDAHSRDYWGDIAANGQRLVEAADIARVLWLTRAHIWDRLSEHEKFMVASWLMPASRASTPRDNWMLFPIIVDLVLTKLHAPLHAPDLARAHSEFAAYRQFYRESGWFFDYPNGVDFYNAWGITYELFWINQVDPTFEANFVTTAINDSAAITEHLISPDGIPIMGRSICYRTAVPVPVVAASFADTQAAAVEAAPRNGRRALDAVWRHFIGHGAILDGALTQGYYGPDLRFLDVYSGPGSCQWGLRSLVLAFMHGVQDGFWTEAPGSLPIEAADYRLEYPKLGWRIVGKAAGAEIVLEIPRNSRPITHAESYGWLDRFLEIALRRPFRPHNHEVKYESRYYSSAHPFPTLGDVAGSNTLSEK